VRRFEKRSVRSAVAYAADGGQALHVFEAIKGMPAPGCFRRSKLWAHLFDQNAERLRATARRLGVRVVVVHHPETVKQHVDLCGKPLECALAMCEEGNLFEVKEKENNPWPRRN
jgi:hypothetical protein